MSNEFSIKFPKEQVNSILAQMKRAEKELGKTTRQATEWAGRIVCESVAGATKKSATKRPIVKNPDPRAGVDKRIGLFGVMKYVKGGNGKQFFDPIYKGGEFGQQIKYLNKGSVLLKVGTEWVKYTVSELKANQRPDLAMSKHPKTKVGRSGLAKKVWQWCKTHTRVGGKGSFMGVSNCASVKWTGADRSTLVLESDLRYAMDALKSGGAELQTILASAGDSMAWRIDEKLGLHVKEMAK